MSTPAKPPGRRAAALKLLLSACLAGPASAQETAPGRPAVALATAVEDGRRMIVATVTLDGKPVEGAQVAFVVARTFGRLALGREETLDDGTAAVPFPEGLPGDPAGGIRCAAEIAAPPGLAGARGEAVLPGGRPFRPDAEAFPAALWSPSAPPALVGTIAVLLGGVWSVFVWVLVQMRGIRKGGSS